MKHLALFIPLFLIVFSIKAQQDLIITSANDSVYCTITSFDEEKLYFTLETDNYKRSYSVNNLSMAIFSDGQIIDFQAGDFTNYTLEEPSEEETFLIDSLPEEVISLAPRNSKVFIKCVDHNAVIHAKDYLDYWGYWKAVSSYQDADFILKINIRYQAYATYIAFAQFINPKTNKIIYSTPEIASAKSPKKFDFNQKRSAIIVLFSDLIKPYFK